MLSTSMARGRPNVNIISTSLLTSYSQENKDAAMGSRKAFNRLNGRKEGDSTVKIIVDCRSCPEPLYFEVEAQLPVHRFVEKVLATLGTGEKAEQVRVMQAYYEPVLELVRDGSAIALNSRATLQQAGIRDQALCRISAKPRKERMMCCSRPTDYS